MNHSADRVRCSPFYYSRHSNAYRGLGEKKNLDDLIPSFLEPEDLKPNHTWTRLI
jgi:hypothetical protein